MTDVARESREGPRLGNYRLRRLLGSGGTAEVWEAADTRAERVVALKVWPLVFSHDSVFCSRLQRQARIVGQLDEPHIVPITNAGQIDGRQFLEMQFVDGADLATLLQAREPLAARRAIAIIGDVASALDAVHAIGVVHGDVKPRNILVASTGRAHLVDIGISDASPYKGVSRVIGSTATTWKYTAPERFTASTVDHRADIYALACVLYECLTESPPYWADTAGALIGAHLIEPIPRPSRLQPAIPRALDEVIARGMAKDPAERYDNAGALARAAFDALSVPNHPQGEEISAPSRGLTRPDAEHARAPVIAEAPAAPVPAEVRPPAPVPMREPQAVDRPSDGLPPVERIALSSTPPFGLVGGGGTGVSGGPSPGGRRPTPPGLARRSVLSVVAVVAAILLAGGVFWLVHPSDTSADAAATSSTQPAPAAVQDQLLRRVPRDYPTGSCTPMTAPQGALGALSCASNSAPDGPRAATYQLFADASSLRGALHHVIETSTVTECPGRIQSPGLWYRNASPDQASGTLVCGTQDGVPMVAWTDDARLLISVAKSGPQGPTIEQLYRWWASHS